MTARALALALVASLAACDGNVGLIEVSLVSAPNSTVMDDVVRALLTRDQPLTVVEADRDADGRLFLGLDVEASGASGVVTFEGLDAAGNVIAYGRSGVLPIAAFDGRVDVYVAPPMSLREAPVALETARSNMGMGVMNFGVLLAGGRDAQGAPTDDMVIYNVYDHALQVGAPLPSPREGITTLVGSFGLIYLFGGTDDGGDPTATLWRFDTNVAPAGAYDNQLSDDELARTGARGAALGQEAFLVTGDPPVVIDGLGGRAGPIMNASAISGTVNSINVNGIVYTLIAGRGAGVSGASLFVGSQFVELDPPAEIARVGHETVTLPSGDMLVVAGETLSATPASAIRFDPLARSFTTLDDFLTTPRVDAATTSSRHYLVVAGGTDESGAVLGDAEVFDAETLAPVATVPLVVPRTGAHAGLLSNGQILIAGGVDATGTPIDVLELFTPAP